MDESFQEHTVPITTDARTFEQRQKDFVSNLERRRRQAGGIVPRDELPVHHVVRRGWTDELDHWLGETSRRWNDYMRRMERDMFALAPVTELDLQPLVPFGSFDPFGYTSSIIRRMEQQRDALWRLLDSEPMMRADDAWGPLVPRERRDRGALDFLKDAYEVGDDGRLRFKVKFDVRGFGPDDIKVSASKNRLTVHGKKSMKTNTSSSSSEFCRTVYLPESVDDNQFQCHLTSDGILMLEAPVKTTNYEALTFGNEPQLAVKPTSDVSSSLQVTGVPGPTVLKDGATGQRLHVEVPIEPGFTSDDLSVRVDANRVIVSGRKQVVEGSGSSQCSHMREFHRTYTIPETVDPLSVVARLQGETLVVEAPMVKLT